MLTAILALLVIQVDDAAAVLPGDRGNYVTAVMMDSGQSSWVRLAQYSFRDDGSIRQDFWFWDQGTMTGWAPTGLTTNGCTSICSVRTAERFQDGNGTYPRTLFGTYSAVGAVVSITWSGGSTETWTLTSYKLASRLELANSNYGATHGWSWGSTEGFSSYSTISEIRLRGGSYSGPFQQNNWGSSTSGTTSLGVNGFGLCNNNTLSQTTSTTKLYLAGLNNSRQTYYNRQRFDVDQAACIGSGGGHLNQFLQIIDDQGLFRGWVGVEASLYEKKSGGAIVTIYDLNDIGDDTPVKVTTWGAVKARF